MSTREVVLSSQVSGSGGGGGGYHLIIITRVQTPIWGY